MTLTQQVYAQGVLMSGLDDPAKGQLLQAFSRSAVVHLRRKLRPGMVPEDCKADFVAAAALYALAALSESDETGSLEQAQLGDLTIRRSVGNTAAQCLRVQAELIMSPYTVDRFSFRRV